MVVPSPAYFVIVTDVEGAEKTGSAGKKTQIREARVRNLINLNRCLPNIIFPDLPNSGEVLPVPAGGLEFGNRDFAQRKPAEFQPVVLVHIPQVY
jgi:hypothetical protein